MNLGRLLGNGVVSLGGLYLALRNEGLQIMALQDKIDYQWHMGYVSDISFAAALTAFFYATTPNDKTGKYDIWPLIITNEVLITVELGHYFIPNMPAFLGTVFDPVDILAYVAGTGIAYGMNRLFFTRPSSDLENKVE